MKFQQFNYLTIIVLILLLGFILGYNLSWVSVLILMIFWILVVLISSFNVQWNFFLSAISKANTSTRKIALSFDDGPHPELTPMVLELLKQYNAKATFFCIGKNIDAHPEILQLIYNQNHTIGNHSFTHSKFIDFNGENDWFEELISTDHEIHKIIGKNPRFFRPPYGVTTPHLAKALKKTGHTAIGWNVRSFDSVSAQNPERVVSRILNRTKPGSIILLHDHLPQILPILEQLLPELRKRNFTFVTIDELIDYGPYV